LPRTLDKEAVRCHLDDRVTLVAEAFAFRPIGRRDASADIPAEAPLFMTSSSETIASVGKYT